MRRRLDKLEGKRGGMALGPSVIFLCAAGNGEPLTALLTGGGAPDRESGETAEAFTARASCAREGLAE